MKGFFFVVCLLVSSLNILTAGEVVLDREGEKIIIKEMCLTAYTPDYQTGTPLPLSSSFYDYFYSGHTSFPLAVQASPVGDFEGGGLYHVFPSSPEAGHQRRVYYVYILDGNVASTGSIDTNAPADRTERNPTLTMDYDTGNPFFVWNNSDGVFFAYDDYSAMGFPGIMSESYSIFDEQLAMSPIVKVDISPLVGMKRVYITGTGANGVKYLAYTDYFDVADLSPYDPEGWTVYEIPFTASLYEDGYRLFSDFVVTPEGHVALVGTLHSTENYQDNKLFVLANHNFGVGTGDEDWTLYEESSLLQVINPDGYFQGMESVPRSLHIAPYLPRFTADIDDTGNVIMPMTYRLFIPDGPEPHLVKNQGYIKQVRFCFEDEEFFVTDVWPKSENHEAFPYVPWDPEGDGTWEYHHTPEDSFLTVQHSWPVWWWGEEDYVHENYVRISQSGRFQAIVFQESMKARYWYEYNVPGYEDNYGDIYIVVSDDYGRTWYDPVIMSSHPDDDYFEPALEGKIPAYIYLAERIEELDHNSIRLHLSFFDHNDYGSSVHDNSPPTGGTITYLPVDIMIQELSADDDHPQYKETGLLTANYPNPFNPSTTIMFSLPENDHIKLSVYNISGQLVKTLIDKNLSGGEHSAVWNGKNDYNEEVSSGLYFYRLKTSHSSVAGKMLLVK